MRQIIEKFIEGLQKENEELKLFKLEYKGRGVSLNKIYSQGHWSVRHKVTKEYETIFTDLLEGNVDHMEKFSLWIFYNSGHDPDNVVGMEKLFTDCLKGKYVHDDSKKYFRGFGIWPDETLERNTFQFYILKHE